MLNQLHLSHIAATVGIKTDSPFKERVSPKRQPLVHAFSLLDHSDGNSSISAPVLVGRLWKSRGEDIERHGMVPGGRRGFWLHRSYR